MRLKFQFSTQHACNLHSLKYSNSQYNEILIFRMEKFQKRILEETLYGKSETISFVVINSFIEMDHIWIEIHQILDESKISPV